MNHFEDVYAKEIQTLVCRIETYCMRRGLYAPRETIAVAAGLAGESIWHMASFGDRKQIVPGVVLNDPYAHMALLDKGETLADAPESFSPLADLRRLLEKDRYPVEEGPNLRRFLAAYKGRYLSPVDPLCLALSHADSPRLPILKANVDLREELDLLAASVPDEQPIEARYMLSLAALAKMIVKNRDSLPTSLALAIACQTLLATAVTMPFRSGPTGIVLDCRNRFDRTAPSP